MGGESARVYTTITRPQTKKKKRNKTQKEWKENYCRCSLITMIARKIKESCIDESVERCVYVYVCVEGIGEGTLLSCRAFQEKKNEKKKVKDISYVPESLVKEKTKGQKKKHTSDLKKRKKEKQDNNCTEILPRYQKKRQLP